MEKDLEEILQFLRPEARLDLRAISLQYVLGLTGSPDGLEVVLRRSELIKSVVKLCGDESTCIVKDSLHTLVNISAEEAGARELLEDGSGIVRTMLNMALDPENFLADRAFMVLSNLSRPIRFAEKVAALVEGSGVQVDKLVEVCTNTQYNKRGEGLHYVAPLLSNLTQITTVRRYLLNAKSGLIHQLLPFTEYTASNVRRGGVVGVLRNCCFELDFHGKLLAMPINILPQLLLPLAGPEDLDDEDNEKLPIELQYLSPDKKREVDPDIRKMLLEALHQLCATKESREVMREQNVYVILRELHKVEEERSVLLACENVVDILIRTEDEIDDEHSNLRNVEVPEDLQEKFKKMDEDFINDA